MMFQDFANYQFSAADNIGVGNIAHVANTVQIDEAVDRAGAGSVIAKLSNGSETMLGKWFDGGQGELSGGEWQKIALARAFMSDDAQILILDEPTSALDARAEHDLFNRIQKLTVERWRLHLAPLLDGADGRPHFPVGARPTEEAGTHEELVALNGQYADLFELQAQSYR